MTSRQPSTQRSRGALFGAKGPEYDAGVYDGVAADAAGYDASIAADGADDDGGGPDELELAILSRKPAAAGAQVGPGKQFLDEAAAAARAADPAADDPFRKHRPRTIAERESAYHARRHNRTLSPTREEKKEADANAVEDAAERARAVANALSAKVAADTLSGVATQVTDEAPPPPARARKRRRWDVTPDEMDAAAMPPPPPPGTLATSAVMSTIASASVQPPSPGSTGVLDASAVTPSTGLPPRPQRASRWDDPAPASASTAAPAPAPRASRWDATPDLGGAKRSRWDETPSMPDGSSINSLATPLVAGGPLATPIFGAGAAGSMISPEALIAQRWQADVDARNRPLTDAELDAILPTKGFEVLKPPEGYVPLRPPPRLALVDPTAPVLYSLPVEGGMKRDALGIPVDMPDGLQGLDMKPEDYTDFANILDKNVKDEDLPVEVRHKRAIMRLLLKIKNGTPSVRKVAMRQITDRARTFGADALFDQILPLLMSKTLEDQERHLYVKVIDRILHKLDDLVRPHVHKILVVIAPSLIDEDYYARVEGREIISNLAKVAGLPTMISNMRPDIDHQDEFVRNTTARAFAVVTSALGIPSMLPFLKAVCSSKKSWEARHTGQKIIQQIAILMGVAVLPHLRALVDIVEPGLSDDQGKVRLITALAVASLAEASAPYGIESFDPIIKPLWQGIHNLRNKTLAAFLKAIGYVIPLMEASYANYYAREVNFILTREFRSPDEEMKTVVLTVVRQCVACDGVEAEYVRTDIVPDYFQSFWVRRMALDRRNFRAVVDTTVEIAVKIGGAMVIGQIVDGLKNESEPYRRMVVEAVERIAGGLGLSDVDARLEERLVDGLLFAFQEPGPNGDSPTVLKALSVVIGKLGTRSKPYISQIMPIVKWRLNNKNPRIREFAADLTAEIAPVMKLCDEEKLMGHMGEVLYEYLGEEFPDVLGSILRALKSIVEVIGLESMKPPIRELLPRLTPILKNRHEKVQENCILLVGRIADRGAEYVSAKEWMRICFELLELLKAPRKAIRKSAVSTFGYIAKAIGPSNVLGTLLNNLKVQERTQRVCTTVAIAIVADQCKPYTVLPSLMNEYRIPELNVQNGVLKSLSFLFEYIGDAAGDYIYAITPVLEDALIDRDLVHRQTACTAVGHLALGVRGLGKEDALIHLLNHVWPNAFETSPHVINAVMSAIRGCTVSLGPAVILLYVLQGLFHPARKVREVYWKMYNALYVYAQDALVASYPSLDTADLDCDGEGCFEEPYKRHELFLLV